jgi:hypothetical protein
LPDAIQVASARVLRLFCLISRDRDSSQISDVLILGGAGAGG